MDDAVDHAKKILMVLRAPRHDWSRLGLAIEKLFSGRPVAGADGAAQDSVTVRNGAASGEPPTTKTDVARSLLTGRTVFLRALLADSGQRHTQRAWSSRRRLTIRICGRAA